MKSRKIIRTGNSLCLTIPSDVIKKYSLKEGDIAMYSLHQPSSSITYVFSGHPKQLSLIDKRSRKG